MNDSATLTSLVFLGRTLQYGSGLLLLNVAVFRWLVIPDGFARLDEEDAAIRRFMRQLDAIFIASAAALALSGVMLFLAAAAGMGGTPLSGVFDRTLLSTVLQQTEFGRVCQVRCILALLLAAAIGCRCLPRSRRSAFAVAIDLLATLLAGALFLAVASTGHAAAAAHPGLPWPLLFDSAHLALASVWPAGLLPFALFLSCMKESYRAHLDLILETVRRFSATSLLAVGGLALTGLANAYYLVGSFHHLLGSTYGHVLCLKLIVFAGMLGVATWNRQVLLPRLFASGKKVNADAAAASAFSLRRFVIAEIALAALVIMIVAVLGVTPPPATVP